MTSCSEGLDLHDLHTDTLTEFVSSKIMKSIAFEKNNTPEEILNENQVLIKYLNKSFENINILINLEKKETKQISSHLLKSTIKDIFIHLLNNIGKLNILNTETISLKFYNDLLREFIEFNGNLFKTYGYPIFDSDLLSDYLFKNLDDVSQKHIIDHYSDFNKFYFESTIGEIDSNLKQKNYEIEEIYESLELLINDNFYMLSLKLNKADLFNNLYNKLLRDIYSNFKGYYLYEVQLFSNIRKIDTKKILCLINILLKFYNALNENFKILSLTTSFQFIFKDLAKFSIITDLFQLLHNFVIIIIKELNKEGLDKILALNEIEENIENILEAFNLSKKVFNEFKQNIKESRINTNAEMLLVDAIIDDLLSKVSSIKLKNLKSNKEEKALLNFIEDIFSIVLKENIHSSKYALNLENVSRALKNLKNN